MEQLKSAWGAVMAALPQGIPAWVWVAAVGGLVLFWLYLRVFSARIAWRIILRFFLTILVPLALILGGLLFGLSQIVTLEPGVWQVIMGAAILAAAVIAARVDMLRDRAARTQSLHRMFHAEIAAAAAATGPDDVLSEYSRQMIDIMQANPGFVPTIPDQAEPVIFATHAARLTELPPRSAGDITAYYAQDAALRQFVKDMRSPSFPQLSGERRINMYRDYIAMKRASLGLAHTALTSIEKHVKGNRDIASRSARAGL